jgi:tetratricopeptide (TPR) repeat protein
MSTRKRLEVLALVALAAVLGYFVSQRIGMRMGGSPSSLTSRFESEDAWILDEIVRDLAEMAVHGRGLLPDTVDVALERDDAAPAYRIEVRLGSLPLAARTVSLDSSAWSPASYGELAGEMFLPGVLRDPNVPDASALSTLLEPSVSVLETENARISERLASDIHDPAAHEEAALLLGAFALREATYRFEDIRFLLGRMTAHLAAARALRHGAAPGPSGRVAEATLLTLTGRQEDALRALEGFSLSPPESSWRDALYMYSTQDWRQKAGSGRSLLERRERFRAMATALYTSTAVDRMSDDMREGIADWGRIVTSLYHGDASDRQFIESQLGLEIAELQEAWLLSHGSPLEPNRVAEVLNVPASRLIGDEGPRVLGWGLWAAFYQRHILGLLAAAEENLRESLGLPEAAERFGGTADRLFADLTLAPILQVRRTRKAGGRVEDTVGMDDSIALTRSEPELVNATNWFFIVDTATHMMRKRGMPSADAWFSRAVLAASVLDPDPRLRLLRGTIDETKAIEAVRSIAPRHPLVLDLFIDKLPTAERTVERLTKELGERLDFDLGALGWLRAAASNDEAEAPVLARLCDLDANSCSERGWALVRMERPEEAVAVFQKMVDEAPDRIGVCNDANWLVDYYYDHGRREDAIAIAEMVAGVYCSWGLRTQAHLFERMGQFAHAEELYRANAERYDSEDAVSYPILGFYYRMANREGGENYQAGLSELLAPVFPRGLEPLPEEPETAPPTDGVLIDGDNETLKKAGLRGADVIVGLDGFRIRSLEQYDAVREFRARVDVAAKEMRVRVYRQTQYLDLAPQILGRRFFVRVRTYGTPGPSVEER